MPTLCGNLASQLSSCNISVKNSVSSNICALIYSASFSFSASCKCSFICKVQLPEGHTMYSNPAKFFTNNSLQPPVKCSKPELAIGCPQQVCFGGYTTVTPAFSNTCNVA